MAYNPNNPNGSATSANSAPVVVASDQAAISVKQSTASNLNGVMQLNDGTNTANVVAGDTGQSSLVVSGARKEVSFSTTTTGAQILLANTDVSNYRYAVIQLTSAGTSLAFILQGSNDGSTYNTLVARNLSSNTNGWTTASQGGVVSLESILPYRYFQISITAMTAGTTAGKVEFFTVTPSPMIVTLDTGSKTIGNVSQTGAWTVGSNSATGSAFPTNAFGQGVKALTASPAAATTGNLVAVMGNTMGMPVIAQALLNSAVAVSASITVVKNAPGYLSGVLVTTAGTSTAMTFYDNASAASGTVIGIVPTTATAGTFWPFNMPALNGITASGSATNPATTVAYS